MVVFINKIKRMSETKIRKLYVQAKVDPPKVQKFKSGLRVQFINQDLKQAIKQIKNNLKDKYKSNVNPTDRNEKNVNPETNADKSTTNHLFYTQTYKKKMEARMYEIQQRKKQLNARSLQKQMKARLIRKIQENVNLRQKMDLLKDVQQRRQLILAQRNQKQKRRKEQQKMLHESSIVNAQMMRRTKKKTYNSQLKESRIEQQQSLKDLKFKNYLTQKQKQQRQMLLSSRFQFLVKNKSQTAIELRDSLMSKRSNRKSGLTTSRKIKTSHLSNRKDKTKQEDEQQLIIQQYSIKRKQMDQVTQGTSKQVKSQKKYNRMIRGDSGKRQRNEQDNQQMKQIGAQNEV